MEPLIEFKCKLPDDLTQDELGQLVELIYNGGENTKINILPKLKQAKAVYFAHAGNMIVATVVVKQPGDDVREDIFIRAKTLIYHTSYLLETGFWATSSVYRGKGLLKTLLGLQMEKINNSAIYCIVNHEKSINLLTENYGFKITGEPFISKKSGKQYHLLIKNEDTTRTT